MVAFIAAVIGNLVRFIFIKRLIPAFRIWHFFAEISKGVAFVLFSFIIIGVGIKSLIPFYTIGSIIISSIIADVFGILAIYCLGLSTDERLLLAGFLKRKLSALNLKKE